VGDFNVRVVGDNSVKIWDVLSGGRLLMSVNSHHKTVTSLCFCMNYTRLVSASLDRFVLANLQCFICDQISSNNNIIRSKN